MKKTILLICICLLFFLNGTVFAKVRILTFHYNKADFIELQYKTFKKFMLDDFELIVFNDARFDHEDKAIQEMCEKYKIPCIRFQQEWHVSDPLNDLVGSWLQDPKIYSHLTFGEYSSRGAPHNLSIRHCHVIQYAMDNFGYNHDDIVIIADGDIFPIRPVNVRRLLAHHEIIGIRRYYAEYDVEYFWVPFIAFDNSRLANHQDLKFNVDVIKNKLYDTGAATYHFLKNNPQVRAKKYPYKGSSSYSHQSTELMKDHGFNDNEISLIRDLNDKQCVEFHINHKFLHYCGSSFGLEGHEEKTKCVKTFIKKILKE